MDANRPVHAKSAQGVRSIWDIRDEKTRKARRPVRVKSAQGVRSIWDIRDEMTRK
ncbi:hypothetical protein KI387_010844, partial [Taxus chinensis]